MLMRFLYGPDGCIRLSRIAPVLGCTIALAIFGGALIFVTPHFAGNPAMQTGWVIFAVLLLKLPLIVLLWSFVRRNKEWPGKPVRWSARETAEILAYLEHEANAARGRPDSAARLAYLSREAWNVADQVAGDAKVDALTVALRIDELSGRVGHRPAAG